MRATLPTRGNFHRKPNVRLKPTTLEMLKPISDAYMRK